eukprot:CAMPEP_0113299360 /NCGR_PEP_ID=MMETSP0010_2-20120614/1429_1 /TAXON_ID=216773 ORGANISM="Corethron hystrix, Strain 308" /NCGR_SAMPLE_ID=MMETSP0010_2 /ASSEMBLY_ACC=CAM_ASM_000155 /LENGTH=219 /DNA_ID=CAMNT_0000152585 /DNA_START=164 /DNA_END=823 /DNA_ORIENTATION=- /assembly_acc=CAM_ASM_000155
MSRNALSKMQVTLTRDEFSKLGLENSETSGSDPIDNTGSVRSQTKSFLERIDSAGLRLKTKALTSKSKAMSPGITPVDKTIHTVKACAMISLFILYRAYRGIFVILPQVFRRVFEMLEESVDSHPFEDDLDDLEFKTNGDVTLDSGKVRKRTTLTVSVVATIITASYVLGGAIRVFKSFLNTAISSKNIMSSFESAGDEIVSNEGKILRRIARTDVEES